MPEQQGGRGEEACLAHWLAGSCSLAVSGGGAPYLRLWDMLSMRCSGLLHTGREGGSITCISSAWPGDSILICGTAGGAIHVLDTRLASGSGSGNSSSGSASARSCAVMTLREHKQYVVNVSQARSASAYAMVSGSLAADVRSWDLRLPRCVHSHSAHRGGSMTCLAQHDYGPLLATGSAKQQAKVFTNAGDMLCDIRFHEGFAGQRIGQVSALAWHPHKLLLAVGATDNMIDLLA
jgi:regulator-associated protein of mTOR